MKNPINTPLTGVIFDLDGTLVDSAPDIRNAINAYLAMQERRPLTLDEVKRAVGDGAMILVERALGLTGEKPAQDDLLDHVQKFIKIYRDIQPDPAQIYPGVIATLQNLQSHAIALGICTNKPESATLKLLDALKLTPYFGAIAGGDTYPVHKPNPDHLRGVITTLDVPVTGCVMVGDSSNDLAAAHGLGIPCILVDYGYGSDVAALPAEAVINDMTLLIPTLTRLGFNTGE
jgi:phosphoglycolate phosphatase